MPMAKVKIPPATTIWEEWSDVTCLAGSLPSEDYCDNCLLSLSSVANIVGCKNCPSNEDFKRQPTRFCSQDCLKQGLDAFHGFYCKANSTVHGLIDQLRAECRETGQTMPLLVLRYLTILLKEELAGRGTASGVGPFTHYDHLRPQYRTAPNESDRAEADLLRRIICTINENVADFLTDEIYVTMRGTLAANVIGTHPISKLPSQLTAMQTRQTSCSVSLYSLFHAAAHLQHSCDPNVALVPSTVPSAYSPGSGSGNSSKPVVERKTMSLKVTAVRGIAPGEILTMSYLPFEDKTTRAERRLHLKRVFSFECKCARCEREA